MYSKQTHTYQSKKQKNCGQDQQKQTMVKINGSKQDSLLRSLFWWLYGYQERQVSFKIRKYYP